MDSANDWAIRTMPRERIVEYLLTRHFGPTFAGQERAEAVAEIEAELDGWITQGLPYATAPNGAMGFDPTEVFEHVTRVGRDDPDSYWMRHWVRGGRGFVLEQFGLPYDSDEVPDPASLRPRAMAIRLERIYNCAALPTGRKARLKLPLPLENETLSIRRLACEYPEGAQGVVEPGRLTVTLPESPGGVVSLAMTAQIDVSPQLSVPCLLGEEEQALYTRLREGLIVVDEAIAADARRLAGHLPDDFAKARALFFHILDKFRFGTAPYHALDPASPLQWSRRVGMLDCQLGASLLCAMCRSLGIPARVVNGYELYPLDLAFHYWAEVWTPGRGWSSFDSMGSAVSAGGRDHAWREVFAGQSDYRMKVEVAPLTFIGASSVRLPEAWHIAGSRRDGTYETAFLDARTGALVYLDRLSLA